ncbi:DEAD/DEAH box helicase [Candidatus Uabimicrobium amorphum]|uniref:Putative ATP-dependent helicase YprA n=1 Tax=Uabimicrobium amorphum TaxID=2596890 RepID=A0A5S9IU00_UABAM|nr:DEAD/DEAH box helicase [Candidatus Uabimicrobium amorphum]BBM87120.1 putative ATP-dependent helicase YprA [Candidatus Uabimicrobium amorphum]
MDEILKILYEIERDFLERGVFDFWITAEEITKRLPHDLQDHGEEWVLEQLKKLWKARKVLQVPHTSHNNFKYEDIELQGLDCYGSEKNLKKEENDCRNSTNSPYEQVAVYEKGVSLIYRSRVAEVIRLLSSNYQRFDMAPSTGVLRYKRQAQLRPKRDIKILDVSQKWQSEIKAGELNKHRINSEIDQAILSQAVNFVLRALANFLGGKHTCLATFQVHSILATLCGLYCNSYRSKQDAHVITAGVGSGKTFAFQVGALIHVAYNVIRKEKGIKVLLLYPRVVLAANQFRDLFSLIEEVNKLSGASIPQPILDAGGQLKQQMSYDDDTKGANFRAIRDAYNGNFPMLISNMDTLANRLVHPEACQGLAQDLDLVILDEIHLLNGIYGSHTKMLLKRIMLMRAICKSRKQNPKSCFKDLLENKKNIQLPYYIGASATIAEPCRHTSRVLGCAPNRVLELSAKNMEETGWVHHVFLQQRPEVSSITALVNATSCLIHNRRNGLFREYYQLLSDQPIALSDLGNPVQTSNILKARLSSHIHKTLGFCDSLDGIGRWADLVADNEKSKSIKMFQQANPQGNYPYFIRFQEPLWRVIHHLSFRQNPSRWQQKLRSHYGDLCKKCKQGIKTTIDREPDDVSQRQLCKIQELWDFSPQNANSYLSRLGVRDEFLTAQWFQPLHESAQSKTLSNLDKCPFFKCGLCWWWSMDHAGSNTPQPLNNNSPLNGLKQPTTRNHQPLYNFINSIRLRSFTSRTNFNALTLDSINDIFSETANVIFRDIHFEHNAIENSAFLIGSPRLEVGVDLDLVQEGITFKAMSDPSSIQQKVGRVGRELLSDTMLVHIVTENIRDQYYFRNPQIALDPDYLQPIPFHEDNRIIACHHFFMAIIDFLCLQNDGPNNSRIQNDGHRINLINDHQYDRSFSRWDKKVEAVYNFLFGNHPCKEENLKNLKIYLTDLGAKTHEISNPTEVSELTSADAPLARKVGVIDVFQHEFGPNFFLTPLPIQGNPTLAEICASKYEPPTRNLPGSLGRHERFLQTYDKVPPGQTPNASLHRSYLWNLLSSVIFRRGVPEKNIPSNQPYLWPPNLFEASGNETVRVFEMVNGQQRELGYETVSLAISLLLPGTITYRYSSSPRKVPVSQLAAQGFPNAVIPRVQGVYLCVDNAEYFEPTVCSNLLPQDLPPGFVGTGEITVYTPRQIGVITSSSEPLVQISDGMLADGDSRDRVSGDNNGIISVPTPPRCYPLKWYRINKGKKASVIPDRFSYFQKYASKKLPSIPQPLTTSLFYNISFEPNLKITEFAWGLERQFMSRTVNASRLVYRGLESDGSHPPIAIGHEYQAPGIVFQLDTGVNSKIGMFINEIHQHSNSVVYQSLIIQVLHAFLTENACDPPAADAPPWLANQSRPSVFTVRNLRTIILFHLMVRWHPSDSEEKKASEPFSLIFDEVVGCFTEEHPNFLDRRIFREICNIIARIHEPNNVQAHCDSLMSTYGNFEQACSNINLLTNDFFKEKSLDILINSLGMTIHSAALRLTGAEAQELSYFYRILEEDKVDIYLFDTDAFGNGASELVRDHFLITAIERVLTSKLSALENTPDPLPTMDFTHCFEEALHECESSHATHIAFHNLGIEDWFKDLETAVRGEKQIAGKIFEFFRNEFGMKSFDHILPFQYCPEFIAYVSSEYSCYQNARLVGSEFYPVYQSLESAMGFCISGCISCILSPEQNIHGSLNAQETVNKLVLDALYRYLICSSEEPETRLRYPGTEMAHTILWEDLGQVVASCMGQTLPNFPQIELDLPDMSCNGNQHLVIIPTSVPAGWERVFRRSWDATFLLKPWIRPHMDF